jgi:HAE1 family hydrophobic/amphiphilic exporter-1
MVSGVAQVNVFGSQKFAVRINVDPRELAARSIGIDEVASSVQSANSNLPTGTIYGEKTFVADQRPADAGVGLRADDHRLPRRQPGAARRGGTSRRRRERQDGRLVERRALHLPAVQKQPGVNVVQVVDAIKALLLSIEAQLPRR